MNKTPVLVLTRTDIQRLASLDDYFRVTAAAFRAHASDSVDLPPPMEIAGGDGAFHAKGVAMLFGGRRLAALKLNANFPSNFERYGLATIQGAIMLCDAENGSLLAIFDSVEITIRRTAAASAVAMDTLADDDAKTMLICGCGVQGRAHIEALAPLRRFQRIVVFDKDQAKARKLAAQMSKATNCAIDVANTLSSAASASDVIVTTTPSRSPIIEADHIRPGAFIAAVGADNPHKNEISPALMRRSTIVTDVTDQCVIMGDTRAAIAAGAMERSGVRAQLGEVLIGAKSGRLTGDEIIVFDSTGAAFQDLAAASMIVERALNAGVGASIALGR